MVLASILVLLALGIKLEGGAQVITSQSSGPPYVPDELLISFHQGVTPAQITAFYAQYGVVEKEDLDSDPNDDDPEVKLGSVDLPEQQADADYYVMEMEGDARVEYVEMNYLLSAHVLPNDPDFGLLWGLHNTGQTGGTTDADIDAPEAWDITTGSSDVLAAVIDTGIDYNHEDLAANVWTNPGEVAGNGIDDDGNGYVDDVHGINAITDSGDPIDDHGHGTHVAGTIGARGNNGVGVVGVNWTIQIAACKFLNSAGSGTTANAVKCFQYFNDLKKVRGRNVLVTNNSWGGGGFSQTLKDAMEGLDQPGMAPILHVTSAGNSNIDNDSSSSPNLPSSYDLDNIIAVAATDDDDLYASFTSFGATSVDLAAPGVSIRSTVPTGSCNLCSSSGYRSLNGTSMAGPHVAGVAGLLWADDPGLTTSQVKQRLLSGTDYINGLGSNSNKPTLTKSRLNAANALNTDRATLGELAESAAGFQRADAVALGEAAGLGFGPGDGAAVGESTRHVAGFGSTDAVMVGDRVGLGIPRTDGVTVGESARFGLPRADGVGMVESARSSAGVARKDEAAITDSAGFGFTTTTDLRVAESARLEFPRRDTTEIGESIREAVGLSTTAGATVVESPRFELPRKDIASLGDSTSLDVPWRDIAALGESDQKLTRFTRSDGARIVESSQKSVNPHRTDGAAMAGAVTFGFGRGQSSPMAVEEGAQYTLGLALQDGWISFSIPIFAQNIKFFASPATINSNAQDGLTDASKVLVAYRFDSATQVWRQIVSGDTSAPLEGVLVKSTESHRATVIVNTSQTSRPTRTLASGWNLIGLAPLLRDTTMPADVALVDESGNILGQVGSTRIVSPSISAVSVSWTRGDSNIPSLQRWRAYWVFIEGSETLAGFSSTPV